MQLNLSCNSLEALPDSIGQLQVRARPSSQPICCQQLDFTSITTSVPPLIRAKQMLCELDVSFNKLQSLPASIGKLQRLLSLTASYNQLVDVGSGVRVQG